MYCYSMELLLASNNDHKKGELEKILKSSIIVTPRQLGIHFEFEETGTTFRDNSLGKAMHLHALTGKAVIADDSGLCVDALGGDPGVFSARFGEKETGRPLSAQEQCGLLLSKMEGVSDRTAFFICAMSLVLTENRFFILQESLAGLIAESTSGVNGFGYDPVFYLPQMKKTLAQITEDTKNKISHRAKAAGRIAAVLDTPEFC